MVYIDIVLDFEDFESKKRVELDSDRKKEIEEMLGNGIFVSFEEKPYVIFGTSYFAGVQSYIAMPLGNFDQFRRKLIRQRKLPAFQVIHPVENYM